MSRHPYTYAADFIRNLSGYGDNGTKLSRSDASQIRQGIAKAIGMEDSELACKLSDYFQARELADMFHREIAPRRDTGALLEQWEILDKEIVAVLATLAPEQISDDQVNLIDCDRKVMGLMIRTIGWAAPRSANDQLAPNHKGTKDSPYGMRISRDLGREPNCNAPSDREPS